MTEVEAGGQTVSPEPGLNTGYLAVQLESKFSLLAALFAESSKEEHQLKLHVAPRERFFSSSPLPWTATGYKILRVMASIREPKIES